MPSTVLRLKHHYVQTAGGQVHATTMGAGQPLVLIPHGGRSARMYRKLQPALSAHFTVTGIDPPGTGNSYQPAEPVSLDALADDVHLALTMLTDEPALVYGMNGGNKIAASIASRHPDDVAGLIFAGLTHSIVVENSHRQRTLGGHESVTKLLNPAESPEDSWRRQALEAFSFPADRSTEDALDEAADRLRAIPYRQNFYAAVTTYDLEAALRTLKVPTAVLEFATAKEDAEIGRQGARLAQIIGARADAVLELVVGAPLSLEDRPNDLAETILRLSRALRD